VEARGRKLLIKWAARGGPIYCDAGGEALDLNYCIEVLN
jgi:hypothetical protein